MITSFFAPKQKGKAGKVSSVVDQPSSSSPRKRQRENAVDEDGVTVSSKRGKDGETPSLPEEVSELLATLDDNNSCDGSWWKALNQHISSFSFSRLAKFVAQERKSSTKIYPPPEDVFSALNLTPFADVKVVIVGQDPYHGPSQAHGLCFSVRKGVMVPPSLKNIYKELATDPGVDFPKNKIMPQHGYLERWAKQGVLMLNAVLTVRRSQANSHKNKGWELFTDEVIRALDKDRRKKGTPLVFLLWGNPASKKVQTALTDKGRTFHKILCSSHPSPLGAAKTKSPFLGSKCFGKANEYLKELGHKPIDWNVDGALEDE